MLESFKLPKLLAILNITPDSFSDGGKNYNFAQAMDTVEQFIALEPDIIDIGAASTRPGASLVDHYEEWNRLKEILPAVKQRLQGTGIKISLDSYNLKVLEQAAEYIDMINDVSGATNSGIVALARNSKLPIIVMHALTIPADPLVFISVEQDPIIYLQDWMEQKIEALLNYGLAAEQIILDPGIGFNKQHKQSFYIIKNIQKLCAMGYPVLVGHSRKGFLRHLNHANLEQLDLNTALLSLYMANQGVAYLRVHNLDLHKRVLTNFQYLADVTSWA